MERIDDPQMFELPFVREFQAPQIQPQTSKFLNLVDVPHRGSDFEVSPARKPIKKTLAIFDFLKKHCQEFSRRDVRFGQILKIRLQILVKANTVLGSRICHIVYGIAIAIFSLFNS